jgi:hypothetical protein
MVIANTCFQKRWGKVWTHIQNGRKRVIDYCLVERKRFRHVRDAAATNLLHLGSDHRSVRMECDIGSSMKRRRHFSKKSRGNNIGWRPADIENYKVELDKQLQDLVNSDRLQWISKSIDERLVELEASIVRTAELNVNIERRIEASKTEEVNLVQQLIQDRQKLGEGQAARQERLRISKMIQKCIRKDLRKRKQELIGARLA